MAEEEVCICGCCPSLVVSLDSPIGEVWENGCKGVCTDCATPVRSVMLLAPWEQLLKAEAGLYRVVASSCVMRGQAVLAIQSIQSPW